MAEALAQVSTLKPGRHGAAGEPGLRVTERVVGGAVSLAARAAGVEALQAALQWTLPIKPRRIRHDGVEVIWTGPWRWLVLSDTNMDSSLRALVGSAGSVADQSDGRLVLRLEGGRVRDVLAKGVSIDLYPSCFAIGDAAATVAAHIPALLWRDAEDAFVIAVPRSFAGSFLGWLEASALEYGMEVG